MRLAADLDAVSRDAIQELQRRNLTAMVTSARRTPAVLAQWPDLAQLTDPAQIALLPPTSPDLLADLRPPRTGRLLPGGPGPGIVLRTSGTAGQPKVSYHSWQFKQQVDFLGARGVRAGHAQLPRIVANCTYPGQLNRAFFFAMAISELHFPLGSATPPVDASAIIAEHSVDSTRLVDQAAQRLCIRSLAYSTSETGSESAPPGITVAHLKNVFANRYEMSEILHNQRCSGIEVEYANVSRFYRTERGKVPVMVQRI